MILVLLFCGVIACVIFYLKTLQDLLSLCSPKNQQVSPGNVWLMLIPVFNIIYPFILYPKISESAQKEFEERGHPQQGDYNKGIGIAMPILSLCSIIPFIGFLAGLAHFILWIIYWVKSNELKQQLILLPKSRGKGSISSHPDLLD